VSSELEIAEKLAALKNRLQELGSVLVCYSGGVDSALLLAISHRVLGTKAVAFTAISPSLAAVEQDAAVSLARELGVEHHLVQSQEMQDEAYCANDDHRCFYCKKELFGIARQLQQQHQLKWIVDGANVDDQNDYRPGSKAAQLAGVLSPLTEAGFRKADIREAAKNLGLPVWSKPAAACLASRIPYGTRITAELLEQIATFEAALKDFGFRQLRVRHHDDIARIELDPEELARAAEPQWRSRIVSAGRQAGYRHVTLDLTGYRQGSQNEALELGDDPKKA